MRNKRRAIRLQQAIRVGRQDRYIEKRLKRFRPWIRAIQDLMGLVIIIILIILVTAYLAFER